MVKRKEKTKTDWTYLQGPILILIGIGMMFLEHYKPFIDLSFIPQFLVGIGVLGILFRW